MGTGSFPGVESGRGVTLIPHPLLVPRSKNRVQLYLYSPWGPLRPVKSVKPTYLHFINILAGNWHNCLYCVYWAGLFTVWKIHMYRECRIIWNTRNTEGAMVQRTHLQGAVVQRTHLQGAMVQRTHLRTPCTAGRLQLSILFLLLNTLRTGLLNCLNACSRGLTFRHRASCI